MEAVAFFTPRPLPYFPCLLSCIVSSIERLSLHGSPNWKIMDLINWSLNAIDTIFSTRSLPWRNVRSWLHDGRVGEVADRVSSGFFRGGHRRYLPIRNHDNRSSADWIRLCPGLSKNSENRNSCPKPHKAARKGKLMVETRMDRESSRGIGMRLLAPRLNNRNLIFFGSPEQQPRPRSLLEIPLGRALQWDALAFLPLCTDTDYKLLHTHTHTHIKICIHPPTPDPSPPSLWTASLTSGSVTSAGIVAAGPDGCLLELDYFPSGIVVCLWCMCFCAEVFFLFSHCTPQGA